MARKGKYGALFRFKGTSGKKRLIDALKTQCLVAGDEKLASELTKVATLKQISVGVAITKQGAWDNDIHFIIGGKVQVKVNEREVAIRGSGNHIGEMALIDPTVTRSATVVALEPTFLASVSENNFAQLGKKYPNLWRRVAVELGNRLRERNKFHPAPHDQPVVFVGSSSEGLPIAEHLRKCLARMAVVPRLWTDDVFLASKTIIENLMNMANQADFAVLVLTRDDTTISRGQTRHSPRDNVIFELGLFIGAVGRDRTYILKPKGFNIKIPSDLLGVTCLEYTRGGPGRLGKKLRHASRQLRKLITMQGPR